MLRNLTQDEPFYNFNSYNNMLMAFKTFIEFIETSNNALISHIEFLSSCVYNLMTIQKQNYKMEILLNKINQIKTLYICNKQKLRTVKRGILFNDKNPSLVTNLITIYENILKEFNSISETKLQLGSIIRFESNCTSQNELSEGRINDQTESNQNDKTNKVSFGYFSNLNQPHTNKFVNTTKDKLNS